MTKKRSGFKTFLLWILAIGLVVLGVFLIIQAVYYGNLDHALQLEANGFYKEDVTMLTFGQSAARVGCWIGGAGGVLSGLFTAGVAADILSL